MRHTWLFVLAACGRIGFDPRGTTGDGSVGDGVDAEGDAQMLGNFTVPVRVAEVSVVGNDDLGPSLGLNDLELHWTSNRTGYTLWSASRLALDQPFGTNIERTELNTVGPIEYDPETNASGLVLLYGTNAAPNGVRMATRVSATDVWGNVTMPITATDRTGAALFFGGLRMMVTTNTGQLEEYSRANPQGTWQIHLTHPALAGIGYAAVSDDGLELFGTDASQKLFRATRTSSIQGFGTPTRVMFGSPAIDAAMVADPELSADERTMFLAIDFTGNDYDIYVTTR